VEQGQPVLLGYTDNVGATGRHSILAVGTGKDGQLQVIDSWDGQKKSLHDALKLTPSTTHRSTTPTRCATSRSLN